VLNVSEIPQGGKALKLATKLCCGEKEKSLINTFHELQQKRVLSAERYRKADLTDLKEQLKKHHPI